MKHPSFKLICRNESIAEYSPGNLKHPDQYCDIVSVVGDAKID